MPGLFFFGGAVTIVAIILSVALILVMLGLTAGEFYRPASGPTVLMNVKLSSGEGFKVIRPKPTEQGMGERALRKNGMTTKFMWLPPQVVEWERKHDEHMYQLLHEARNDGIRHAHAGTGMQEGTG